jgi:hypothetical protein
MCDGMTHKTAAEAVIKTGLTPFTLESFKISHLQVPPLPPFTLILHDNHAKARAYGDNGVRVTLTARPGLLENRGVRR